MSNYNRRKHFIDYKRLDWVKRWKTLLFVEGVLRRSNVLVDFFRLEDKLDDGRTVDIGDFVGRGFWWCQDKGGFRRVFGEDNDVESISVLELNKRRVRGDEDSLFIAVDRLKARKGLSAGRFTDERWIWLLLRKKLGGERVLVKGDDFGLLVVAVETFWQELAWPRREGALRIIGEFERVDVSVNEWRLRILFLDFVEDKRRLVVEVVVAVVVTVDDEETSSGSTKVCDGGGEVARFFNVSSVSFSFQIRRDTAQRCICLLDRIEIAALLFVDVDRKLSADGVRFVNVLLDWFCWPVEVNVG